MWLVLLAACTGGLTPNIDMSGDPPDLLSELGLMAFEDGEFRYADGVVPYQLNTPLFSDYAIKDRVIYLPEGASAVPGGPGGVLNFPVGTVILKTFSYPTSFAEPRVALDPVETRLLWHTESGWEAWPYLWNDDNTDADLRVGGHVLDVDFVDPDGASRSARYLVPQRNQCLGCHETVVDGDTALTPIGPKPRNLTGDGLLDELLTDGVVTGVTPSELDPAVVFDDLDVASLTGEALDHAARDYLDVNCAHCHRPDGVQGVTSQLFLNVENTSLFNLGVCKRPGSAGLGGGGLEFDIVPGDPDQSILVFRLSTEDPGAMMPLLGRSVTHTRGVDLIRAWIAEMPADDCQ